MRVSGEGGAWAEALRPEGTRCIWRCGPFEWARVQQMPLAQQAVPLPQSALSKLCPSWFRQHGRLHSHGVAAHQTPEDMADSVDTCGGMWLPTEASRHWWSVWPKHRGDSYGPKALEALSLSTLRPVSATVPIKTSLMSQFHASVFSFHCPQRTEPPSPLPGRGVSRTAPGGLRAPSWRA